MCQVSAGAQAVADRLGLHIVVLSTFEESPVIEIHPQGGARSDRVLHLSFWAEARTLLPRCEVQGSQHCAWHGLEWCSCRFHGEMLKLGKCA